MLLQVYQLSGHMELNFLTVDRHHPVNLLACPAFVHRWREWLRLGQWLHDLNCWGVNGHL
jgi:hypothetical protein